MSIHYDHTSLISLCNKIHSGYDVVDADEVNLTYEELENITARATDSVKKVLYSLVNDTQRLFFLKDVFSEIFHPRNILVFYTSFVFDPLYSDVEILISEEAARIVEHRKSYIDDGEDPETYVLPTDKYFLDEKSRYFILRCQSMVYRFTWNVSQFCYDYKIPFEDIASLMVIEFNRVHIDLRTHLEYITSNGLVKGRNEIVAIEDANSGSHLKIHVSDSQRDQSAKKNTTLALSDIFESDYKDHAFKFFEVLKEPELALLSINNEWIGKQTDCRAYYDLLKLKGIINSKNESEAARIFEYLFKVSPASFVKAANPSQKKREILLDAIERVKSDIPL